jgi:4-hydroxy-2-oxoheptanedioate aldolase
LRGDLTVCHSPGLAWHAAERTGRRAWPQVFTDVAIHCVLTLKVLFRLPSLLNVRNAQPANVARRITLPDLFRDRLARGERLIALAACVLRTPEVVLLARSCSFDWLLIDLEHTPITIGEAGNLAVAARTAGFPALIRVGGPHHPDLARALDIGADGVVVPHVDTPEEAARIVALCRFAPAGRRSLPAPLPQFGYRMPPAPQFMAEAEAATVVIPMIESRAGLEAVEAIAATSGLDALMVGANDLAADLGLPGRLDHPVVQEAFARIAAAAEGHGLRFAVIGVPEALLGPLAFDLGASLVVATNDINLLVDGGVALTARLRGHAP